MQLCTDFASPPAFLAAWSANSLPGIPTWAGTQLIIGFLWNHSATLAMLCAVVLVCLLMVLNICAAVRESVCITDTTP